MRVATELVRQATRLQEKEQAVRRLEQQMNQADQRAKDAEDKASAKTPEQKKTKLNNRDAEKFWPETYSKPRGQEELRGVLGRGRYVPDFSCTRHIGETAAGMGCRLPQPGDRDE